MLEWFAYLWFIGMLMALLSGGLSVKCFFYLTGGGIASLFKKEKPSVPFLMKSYRKGELYIDDPTLRRYFDWIFYSKWLGITSFIMALILYFGSVMIN